MMTIHDLVGRLNEILPFRWAEEWDNVGLLLGRNDSTVHGVAVSLDPDLEAMKGAVHGQCNVLVTHHPLLFSPLRSIDLITSTGSAVCYAIRNELSVIALHTNWDSSPRGVNVTIASALGLQDILPLVPSDRGAWGAGAVGTVALPEPPEQYAATLKETLSLSRVEVYGDRTAPVRRVALCGGSGGDLWRTALESGADTFCTADMKYHEKKEAVERGLRVFSVDHGEMESFSLDALCGLLREITDERVVLVPSTPLSRTFLTL